ncbi:translation initiation factor eIF-2B [Candidatus Woesearchaeota archaeon]|nr:translation initiation factor eIF-2B [Candidatus Woesearchaeota archaeon]
MYSQIINDIRELKIQGAINVAKSAVEAFSIKLEELYQEKKSNDINEFVKSLNGVKIELFSLRSTEPCLRNALNFIFSNITFTTSIEELFSKLKKNIELTNNHFTESKMLTVKYGSKKLTSGMTIFTHCHASTVTSIILDAKKQGKNFKVHNTETRPLFQGRITAKELADNGIDVELFVDSAARVALKKCDIMLIGADAIQSDGTVINKIGSEMFAEIANRYDIPVYICTDSWKFDPASIFGFEEIIEERHYKEVWPEKPDNVKVSNFAFERIKPELISGIISELGIYKPEAFLTEVIEKYPWMLLK